MSNSLLEYEKLKPAEWAGLSPKERLALLKKVEDRVAAEENRKPREIVPVKLKERVNGEYRSETPDYIFINESLINSTYLDDGDGASASLPGYTASKALLTVLHEGRHAYQDDCVKGKNAYINGVEMHGTTLAELAKNQGKLDDETLRLWQMQDLIYFNAKETDLGPLGGELRYYFQPVEDDAERFAVQRIQELAVELDDPLFSICCSIHKDIRDDMEQKAEMLWQGPHYRRYCIDKIEVEFAKYQKKCRADQAIPNTVAPEKKVNIPKDKPNLIRYALFGGILLYLLIMYLIAAPSGLVSHLLWIMAAMIPFLPVILLLRFFPKLHNKKGGILLAAIFGVFLLLMQMFYSWLSLLFLVGTAWVLLKGLGSAAPNLLTITRENADGTTTTETRIVGDDMAAEIAGAKAQLRSEGYTDIREG